MFNYHKPTELQADTTNRLRAAFSDLHETVEHLLLKTGYNHNYYTAYKKDLECANMWINKAITHEPFYGVDTVDESN